MKISVNYYPSHYQAVWYYSVRPFKSVSIWTWEPVNNFTSAIFKAWYQRETLKREDPYE